ncbi:Rho GTPase [Geranomyces michiganensis]|nr:Rho GTPase [Geranomyces michiganensis]
MAVSRKVVIVGDERVGKTALCVVYCGAPFPAKHFPTISDTYVRTGSALELADTAGSYEFDRLRPFSYDNADAFVIAFAVDDPLSLENVEEKWLPEVRYFSDKVPIILVALKTDLRSEADTVQRLVRESLRPVRYDEGETVAARIGAAKYIECSARDGVNVDAVFDAVRALVGVGNAGAASGPMEPAAESRKTMGKSTLSLQIPPMAEALAADGSKLDTTMAGPSTPSSEASQPSPSSSESSESGDGGHQSETLPSPAPRALPRRTSVGGRSIATTSIATANNDEDAASQRRSIKSLRSTHSIASRGSSKAASSIKQIVSSPTEAKSPDETHSVKISAATPPGKVVEQIPVPSTPPPHRKKSGGCKCMIM